MQQDKREIRLSYLLMISLCLVFTFSIGIKAVYNTALVEIRAEYNLTNFETQIGSFIYYGVYAISQITLGLCIKKVNIKKIFFLSIILTAVCYSCMIFAAKAWILWLLMGISGVIMAPHWMGCIYFISKLLKGKYLQNATSSIAIANPLGTALASGVVALFAYLNAWKFSFILLGALMVLSAFMFKYSESKLSKQVSQADENVEVKQEKVKPLTPMNKSQRNSLLITIAIMVLVQILLSGGYTIVKQTLSICLFDLHGVDESLSILLTLFLPVVAMIFKLILYKLYFKYKNYLLISIIGETIAICCIIALMFVYQNSIILSLIFYVISYSFLISGATMLGGSIFGLDIKNKVNAGTSSAILNSGAAIGCAVLPLMSGAILDIGGIKGWNTLFIFLIGIACLVTLILLALLFTRNKNYTFENTDNGQLGE